MRKIELTIIILLICVTTIAQGRRKQSVLQQVSNKEIIREVYPEALKVEEVNQYWYKIVDSKKKTIGYTITSRDYCNHIIGYSKATPVMIVTNKNFIIKKVAILSHYETPSYIQMLEDQDFFNSWNGKRIQKAGDIIPDSYTGATRTALAIIENVKFLSEKGSQKIPGKK